MEEKMEQILSLLSRSNLSALDFAGNGVNHCGISPTGLKLAGSNLRARQLGILFFSHILAWKVGEKEEIYTRNLKICRQSSAIDFAYIIKSRDCGKQGYGAGSRPILEFIFPNVKIPKVEIPDVKILNTNFLKVKISNTDFLKTVRLKIPKIKIRYFDLKNSKKWPKLLGNFKSRCH